MSDSSTDKVVDGRAWEEFCNALRGVGEIVLRNGVTASEIDRAEGWRYLTRLLRGGLESFVEAADPGNPVVRSLPYNLKIGADNPDNLYQTAALSGAHEYRLHGRRGTVHYLGLGAYSGNYADGTSSGGRDGYLEDGQLQVDPEGRFEVALSRQPRDGNWLPMTEATSTLIVRQSFLDRAKEVPAELRIERVGPSAPPAPLTADAIYRGLLRSVDYVRGTAERFEGWTQDFMTRPNELSQLPAKVAVAAHADPNITFYHGYWRLQPGQALLIEVRPPACDYWNFQLNNWWMESLDYRSRQVTVNASTVRLESDGTVRIVIADEDPGVGNWMDTAGHSHGTMGLRWVRASADVRPQTKVVDVDLSSLR